MLRWGLLTLAALLVLIYVGDDLSVRYRMTRHSANDPFETVTIFYATKLKGGKVEIYYNQPASDVCVHALLPHLGHNPCWYMGQTKIVLL